MRTITSHQVNAANEALQVEALDEPGDSGASNLYRITGPSTTLLLPFQYGPIVEAGVNGVTHEALLAIIIDRLEGFQRGKFANEYSAAALHHLRGAADVLRERTRKRIAQGIEGTHKVAPDQAEEGAAPA